MSAFATSHLEGADGAAHVVLFRNGTPKRPDWIAGAPADLERCREIAARAASLGTKTFVRRVRDVLEHGLPDGWDA